MKINEISYIQGAFLHDPKKNPNLPLTHFIETLYFAFSQATKKT